MERYTIGELEQLNHGKVRLAAELQSIFADYAVPPCVLTTPYMNPHNVVFSAAAEKMGGYKVSKMGAFQARATRDAASSDDKILLNLRRAFSSVVSGKDGTLQCVNTINQLIIAKKLVPKIAELFFNTMVQSPNYIPQYINVLFSLKRYDNLQDSIQITLTKHALQIFDNPVVLPDSNIASGELLTRQHAAATCMVVTQMFCYDFEQHKELTLKGPRSVFDNEEKLKTRLLDPLVERVNTTADPNTLRSLADTFKTLAQTEKFAHCLDEYKEQLKTFFADKRFKLTERMPLRDLI